MQHLLQRHCLCITSNMKAGCILLPACAGKAGRSLRTVDLQRCFQLDGRALAGVLQAAGGSRLACAALSHLRLQGLLRPRQRRQPEEPGAGLDGSSETASAAGARFASRV